MGAVILDSRTKPKMWGFDLGLVTPGEWDWFYNGEQAAFPMWEKQGSTIESITSPHTATVSAGTANWITGRNGPEMDFGAGSLAFTVDQAALIAAMVAAPGFSFSVYCNASSFASNKAAVSLNLASDDQGDSALIFYPFDTAGATDGVEFFWNNFNFNENSGMVQASGNNQLFTFSSFSATDHRIYVDGIEVGTSSQSKTLSGFDNIVIGSWRSNSTFPFDIGAISYVHFRDQPTTFEQHAQLALDPFGPYSMIDEDVGVLISTEVLGYPRALLKRDRVRTILRM